MGKAGNKFKSRIISMGWGNLILSVFCIFLFICLLIVLFEPLFNRGWRISATTDGMKYMIEYWKDYTSIITLFGASLTILIASMQLKRQTDIQAINALAGLRSQLNSKEKKSIHLFLMEKDDKEPFLEIISESDTECDLTNADLYDYLGTIELGAIMLKRGVIDFDEFYNQFGYRVENIKKNGEILAHINKYSKNYRYLHYVLNLM